ncbi:hypothetical protein BZL42_02655 [Pseudomonas indica]|nr:hypothetical protein BZL42_02655 [Pseudomonas indica]
MRSKSASVCSRPGWRKPEAWLGDVVMGVLDSSVTGALGSVTDVVGTVGVVTEGVGVLGVGSLAAVETSVVVDERDEPDDDLNRQPESPSDRLVLTVSASRKDGKPGRMFMVQ